MRSLSNGGCAQRPSAKAGASGERFFAVDEIAEILNVCERTVRRWIAAEKLTAHRFGTVVRIAESDLAAFIARHRGV